MPPVVTVKQGECIGTIAYDAGFFWETIWKHPRNAQLKRRRGNPNVLMAGDQVFIPDKQTKEEPCATGMVHTFRMKGIPIRFKIRILDALHQPRAGVVYELDIDGSTSTGVTPEDGLISRVIEPAATKAKLKLNPGGSEEEIYEFSLGHLNPADDISGLQSRLKNLGYLDGEPSGSMDDATREAIRNFQAAANLEITGEANHGTRDVLLTAHGS
jgi:N-acetylmuramoyl-L-alanine amidase